jgi:hypothetical protein
VHAYRKLTIAIFAATSILLCWPVSVQEQSSVDVQTQIPSASKWTLVAGYRDLFVDYRPTNLSVYSTITSGALLGITYTFK